MWSSWKCLRLPARMRSKNSDMRFSDRRPAQRSTEFRVSGSFGPQRYMRMNRRRNDRRDTRLSCPDKYVPEQSCATK